MAEQAGISPSVLSAIYSTVLPAYLKNTEKGENEDEALNNALVWVNNVSKKKLLGSLANLKNSLFAMEIIPKSPSENKINPFLTQLENNMLHIPADTRSAFPVISVQSPVSIQCCWQS